MNVILDLASKRASLVSDGWDWASGEMGRMVDSVFHARSLTSDARMRLRPRSHAFTQLRAMAMAMACNEFLQSSERDSDDRLKTARQELIANLTKDVAALHSADRRRVLADAPGSFALGSRKTLAMPNII